MSDTTDRNIFWQTLGAKHGDAIARVTVEELDGTMREVEPNEFAVKMIEAIEAARREGFMEGAREEASAMRALLDVRDGVRERR